MEIKSNKVIRKHKNELIECTIPPTLHDQDFCMDITLDLNNFDQPQFGEFSLNCFLDRYLAGSRSLKEARSISRKRLVLASSNIGYVDPLAIDLINQIKRYQQAKKILRAEKPLSIDDLLCINKLLEAENSKGGTIRANQNWIGGKTPKHAYYVCPPADFVESMMHDWINFINIPQINKETIAILGHNQLLNIHPFVDGNGRAARVFLQATLEKKYGEIIHPSLYRLNVKDDDYIDAIHSTLEVSSFSQPMHHYWHESLQWGDNLKRRMFQILATGKLRLDYLLNMRSLSTNSQALIGHLWSQPIVCEFGLLKHFGWDIYAARSAIEELVDLSVLKVHRLRNPESAIIYDCPIIFEIWHQLDNEMFKK
jgi:hypothetical protein